MPKNFQQLSVLRRARLVLAAVLAAAMPQDTAQPVLEDRGGTAALTKVPSERDSALMKTFAPWLNQAPPNRAALLWPEDMLEAVYSGLQRVAAALNGLPRDVRRLPDDALGPALEEHGLTSAVAVGLEIPFAGLPLKDRLDYGFHPSRFGTRRVEDFTRLEITLTIDFLNAIMTGAQAPEGVEATTEQMKAGLTAWTARYVFHTLEHQRQGITAANYQEHAGTSRLHADFEADLESVIHLVHAFGFEVSVSGSSPDPGVVALMRRLRCCSAFAVRQSQRGPATLEEVRDRWVRSVAGRISSKLVLNNLVPTSVIVGEATPLGVPVIVNNHCHEVIKGVREPDEIADTVLRRYRYHLEGCGGCKDSVAAHLKSVLNSLETM